MAEKNRPSMEDMKKAEEHMTDEQRRQSEYREKLHTDEATKKYFVDFVKRVLKGERVSPNFSTGPECTYGTHDEPFDGYDEITGEKRRAMHSTIEEMAGWKKILSPVAYKVLEDSIHIDADRETKYGGQDGTDDYLFYNGKTFQSPTSSGGRGSYSYWPEYPDCWIKVQEEEQSQWDEENPDDATNGRYYNTVSIALKMSDEERLKWANDMANLYSIEIPKE